MAPFLTTNTIYNKKEKCYRYHRGFSVVVRIVEISLAVCYLLRHPQPASTPSTATSASF